MSQLIASIVSVAGLGALGALALRHFKSSQGVSANRPPDQPLEPNVVPSPPPTNTTTTARDKAAGEVFKQAFAKLNYRPTDFEFQYAQGVACYETSYGQGWNESKGPGSTSSNNWGSVHAVGNEPSFDWTDSYSDGTRYNQKFKTYPTPVDGAADVVKHILIHRQSVADALKEQGATIWRASLAARRTAYYGSWCLKAVKSFGKEVGSVKAQKDPKTEGELACEKEAVAQHVWRMKKELGHIAPALGMAMLPEGTYEDALAWIRNRGAA